MTVMRLWLKTGTSDLIGVPMLMTLRSATTVAEIGLWKCVLLLQMRTSMLDLLRTLMRCLFVTIGSREMLQSPTCRQVMASRLAGVMMMALWLVQGCRTRLCRLLRIGCLRQLPLST